MLYAGMDVHKKFCQIIRTNEKEIKRFFAGLTNVKVAIESSANYGYML